MSRPMLQMLGSGPERSYHMAPIMENQMEKNMDNEMETLGPFKGVYSDLTPIMENHMGKNMDNVMETGVIYRIRALRV